MSGTDDTAKPEKIEKSQEEWRRQLTMEQFHITRRGATEPAFTGPYLNTYRNGRYDCVCCGQPLFKSDTKFDAGCGWPSFFEAITPQAITEIEDTSFGMVRTEIRCSRCDAHLGHVFPDGPPPTGLRYCLNGHAMTFKTKT